MSGKPRIVVVGGGIAGAFAAYFLARLGAATTLVERDGIGGQASGHNPGGLNPLHGPGVPGPIEDLALESFRLHLDHFSPALVPRLHVAVDEDDVKYLEREKKGYDSTPGFSAEWVEREELLSTEPRLSPRVVRGLRTAGNARVDPGAYTRAVAAAAVELGATTVRAEARGLSRSGERVTEVLLDSGSLPCDGVVIACGPWCAEPARWLSVELPVEPLKGEMLLVEASVGVDLAWRDTAVYAAGADRAWAGVTRERVGFDRTPSQGARSSILERVARLLPGMGRPRVLRQTAALRPATPDGFPIVGMVAGWENACVALGGGRKGMLLSAGIGLAAAELTVEGETRMAIDPCAVARWTRAPVR